MAEPTFYTDGNTPKAEDADYRVEQKILGALRNPASGGDPSDADLLALADMTCTGLIVRTGPAAFACRTLVAPAAGITISNPSGIAGNPTFALADDLAALEALASDGFAVRTGVSTWAIRSITAGVGILVANGSGGAGAPVISLNINGLTEEPTIAAGDFVAIYDVSASAHRKMTRANFIAGLSGSVAAKAARIDKTSSQAITAFTSTPVVFQTETFDTDTIADVVGTPSRLTCKTAGKYVITGDIKWANDPTGEYRDVVIQKNGDPAQRLARVIMNAAMSEGPEQNIATIAHLDVNDYVELVVFTMGAAGSVQSGSHFDMISYG